MSEIIADPAEISAGGTRLRTHCQSIRPVPKRLESDALRTRTENVGFRTGIASQNFAEQFSSVVDRYDKRVMDAGQATIDCAKAWERADEETADDFKRIEDQIESGIKN